MKDKGLLNLIQMLHLMHQLKKRLELTHGAKREINAHMINTQNGMAGLIHCQKARKRQRTKNARFDS